MKRCFAFLLTVFVALSLTAFAHAGTYPDKSIKIIVPFNPGGGGEQGARLLEKDFKEVVGQPLSFIYKPGGTGLIGMVELSRQKPDGYTIGIHSYPLLMLDIITGRAGYTLDSFDFISLLCLEEVYLAVRADSPAQALSLLAQGAVPVLPDPECLCREQLHPDALVDAILAKRNLGTRITDAPVVVGIGPGFTAGEDCHAVVETMRGHTLGRVIYKGSALPNTNIPGLIGGYAGERVLRAPADGVFTRILDIGDEVQPGDIAGTVNGQPMKCTIGGVVRGILPSGTPVHLGMKSGDVDPRCQPEYCTTASDKALAVGGGALEAILHLTGALR